MRARRRQDQYVLVFWYYTYMAKLTLSVDNRVVSRAKHYAKRRGVSISAMVEAYLAAVAGPPGLATDAAPILRSVRGVLKNADIDEYRKHLAAKYR
jgi:hypothetical protein